ncbi:MAG: hypothetical protein CMI60_05980 [Parvibaculum sp.]|nr:hypothetical protein [Parvibaculum sp.]|tara:strand:- start:1941 stop:2402 length:462 start_codon:yes stop_codon:yes gene_type:complete
MKIAKLATVGLIAVSLAGCSAYGAGPREGAGTIIGAIAGGLVGSQFGSGSGRLIATGVGAVAGAALGQGVGRSLDQRDRQHMAYASTRALDTGYEQDWYNDQSGNYGTVSPGRSYNSAQGYCREYQQTVYIGGEPQQAYGTACRQPDGQWQVM